jgi:hypothetical protein
MSMSTHISFLRDKNNEQYQKNLKVLMACKDAGFDPPPEIDEYFGNDGIDCDPEYPLEIDGTAREYETQYRSGYEVDLDDIPEGVKTIRFYNAW